MLVSSDRFTISRLFGSAVYADYSNGAIELPIVAILTVSTTAVLIPAFARLGDSPERRAELMGLWTRSVLKAVLILFPCAVFAFFFAEDVVRFLFSAKYAGSAVYFRIYLAITLVRVGSFMALMITLGLLGWYAMGHVVGCAIAWGCGYGLCYATGNPVWAAVSYVAGVFAISIILVIGLSRRLNAPISALMPVRRMAVYFLASALAGLAAWVCTCALEHGGQFRSMLRLAVGGAVFCPVFMLAAYALHCDVSPITDPLRKALSRIKNRKLGSAEA
jgi:O-antigen/teichoic acid export membrane protein